MSTNFISLNCQNCGGKLDIYPDMVRFFCGYCGTGMIVQRRGGTIALNAITSAIGKVQAGTDKTAAELALARYETEMRALTETASTLSGEPYAPQRIGCTVVLLMMGVIAVPSGSPFLTPFGAVMLIGGLALAWFTWSNWQTRKAELSQLQTRMRTLQTKIQEKRRIVDC
ncbi:MAG TPA: hypothetical protein VGK29_22925 [Paludibaculum sp.]|jgi:ribosomal protein S27E